MLAAPLLLPTKDIFCPLKHSRYTTSHGIIPRGWDMGQWRHCAWHKEISQKIPDTKNTGYGSLIMLPALPLLPTTDMFCPLKNNRYTTSHGIIPRGWDRRQEPYFAGNNEIPQKIPNIKNTGYGHLIISPASNLPSTKNMFCPLKHNRYPPSHGITPRGWDMGQKRY